MDLALDKKGKNKTQRLRYVRGGQQTLVCSGIVYSSGVLSHLTCERNSNKTIKPLL